MLACEGCFSDVQVCSVAQQVVGHGFELKLF